ncbi:hypothetical protein RBSWK_00676 [Rhodopirellula baltica SWK14]|uniref:Uncharacterized protein n=1 Tax=Rhodopirellula baltica SWK14 TaxID=993516 RepID=L7CP42_RHOBT|nr:hypothetical protein RBSWK_00676 [Rhodopirellula baltica SWK14]
MEAQKACQNSSGPQLQGSERRQPTLFYREKDHLSSGLDASISSLAGVEEHSDPS